jgi:hypothetical protein
VTREGGVEENRRGGTYFLKSGLLFLFQRDGLGAVDPVNIGHDQTSSDSHAEKVYRGNK